MPNNQFNIRQFLLDTLLQMAVFFGSVGLAWLIVHQILGYRWQIAFATSSLIFTSGTALLAERGRDVSIAAVVALSVLFVYQNRLPGSGLWITALVIIPLGIYALSRMLRKRRAEHTA